MSSESEDHNGEAIEVLDLRRGGFRLPGDLGTRPVTKLLADFYESRNLAATLSRLSGLEYLDMGMYSVSSEVLEPFLARQTRLKTFHGPLLNATSIPATMFGHDSALREVELNCEIEVGYDYEDEFFECINRNLMHLRHAWCLTKLYLNFHCDSCEGVVLPHGLLASLPNLTSLRVYMGLVPHEHIYDSEEGFVVNLTELGSLRWLEEAEFSCSFVVRPLSLHEAEENQEKIVVPSLKRLCLCRLSVGREELRLVQRLAMPCLTALEMGEGEIYDENFSTDALVNWIGISASLSHLRFCDIDFLNGLVLEDLPDRLQRYDIRSFEVEEYTIDIVALSAMFPNLSCVGYKPDCRAERFQLCLGAARQKILNSKNDVPGGLWPRILARAEKAFETHAFTSVVPDFPRKPGTMGVPEADAIYILLRHGALGNANWSW